MKYLKYYQNAETFQNLEKSMILGENKDDREVGTVFAV